MPDPRTTIEELRVARARRDSSLRAGYAAKVDLLGAQRAVDRADRRDDEGGRDLSAALEEARSSIVSLQREESVDQKRFDGLAEVLLNFSSEDLTALWTADTPILLLPLRIETRYRDAPNQALWVRVFPDEVAVQTHEEALTFKEKDAGQDYWRASAVAADDNARKQAWRKLAERRGGPRASYVLRMTRPTNWDDVAEVGPDGLLFPPPGLLKPDDWTEAPRVRVLPDRLELLLLRAGKIVDRHTGARIPDIVHVGPTPLKIDGEASWERDPLTGRMVLDDQSLWLADFSRAVDEGLGFRVPIPMGSDGKFDELIVLGLKHSADRETGAGLLADLLVGHRYSAKGLALVPQGTATNNTSDEDAGLDTIDWFADASYAALNAGAAASAAAPEPDLDRASDGDRLAAYLGFDPALLHGIPNADGHDHVDAVAMNRALFPGTLGYYLRTMVPEAVSETALEALHDLFTRSVTGRGPLPAIRVGSQPYGLLLAGAAPRLHKAAEGRALPFEQGVETVIARLRPAWAQFVPNLPRIGGSPNASADLLAVLGLQPTSAEWFQRIGATFDHLSNLSAFQAGGSHLGDVLNAIFAGFAADNFLTSLGYDHHRTGDGEKPFPLLFQLIYQRHQNRIPPTGLIDGLPFSETDPIKPYDAAGTRNYIDWLAAHAHDPDILRRQDFGGPPRPTALLYMMLRHALLIQSSLSVNRWLQLAQIDAPELIASRKFVGIGAQPEASAWEIMSAPARVLRGTEASDLPLVTIVHQDRFRHGPNAAIGAPLGELLDAYGQLRGLSTAKLERLLAEHVDTLSYRIDAWETALIDRRLARRRGAPGEQGGARPRTLYLGAVGYLENIGTDRAIRVATSEEALPPALREGKGRLFTQFQSPGFIHAPSLNHATAAAILRNGFLTHATPEEPGRLAVDLSSRRVRRAKALLDGVRNNQPLEVLLGIEFERSLHDATTRLANPVVLNDLKPAFRAAFPIMRARMPRPGEPDDAPELVPDFSVANGIAIAGTPDSFPNGVAGLPALNAARTDELKRIRLRVRESLDALKDIVSTESAYQLALGNFDRAAAIVQSLAKAAATPEIEVIRSSRGTDLAFTQRLAIQFDPAGGGNPWPGIALTARAEMEPALNAWLANLLPAPANIACSAALKEGAASAAATVTIADLAIQPIDLLAIGRRTRDSEGPTELEARVRAAALAATGLSPAADVTISFGDTGTAAAAKGFIEILSILDLVHQVLAGARPLDGRDTLTASKPLAAGTEPSGIDLVELRKRLAALDLRFVKLLSDVQGAVAAAEAPAAGATELALLAQRLREAADAGVSFAFPLPDSAALVAQGKSVAAAIADAQARAAALDDESDKAGLEAARQAELLVRSAQERLGADFRVMPVFSYPNAADIAAAETARDSILTTARAGDAEADPVAEALTSLAQVRAAVGRIHRLRMMQELETGSAMAVAALQLPPRKNDVWLGGPLPPDWEIFDDTLSLLQLRPQGFDPVKPQCGLLIDQWVESLPKKKEVTGLAFGYDQPNSAPLQALMLAVADDGARNWDWDGLVAIVRDTMFRARLRAVEPDKLDGVAGLTTLLPATLAEFSTSRGGLSLDYGLASPLIYTNAVQLGYQLVVEE